VRGIVDGNSAMTKQNFVPAVEGSLALIRIISGGW
jgi:hypothetical protein